MLNNHWTSLVSLLQQGNVKKPEKWKKIGNIKEENPHIL